MKLSLFKAAARYLSILAVGASPSLLAQTSAFVGQDLGAPTTPGGATVNADGSIRINGGGADIYGTSDAGFFYYTSVTGLVWEAKMRILSFDGPDQWSKLGLMVRRPSSIGAPPDAGDPEIMNLTTRTGGQNALGTQHRPTRGASTADHQPSPNIPPNFTNQWLRITRTNAFYTLSYSYNGTTWNTYAGLDATFSRFDTANTVNNFDGTPWENPIQVGVAITSHADANTNAVALITNLTVTVFQVTAPTNAGIATAIAGTTNVYAYTEANFSVRATNSAVPSILYPMDYIWYKNNTPVTTNAGQNFTFLTTPADDGAQIYCIARVGDPLYYSLTATSTVLTLTTKPGANFYTNGLKQEFFAGGTRKTVEDGNVPLGVISMTSSGDVTNLGPLGVNYGLRLSGYFIPPTTTNYVFYVAANDDADVFLSTDSNPINKRLIAQEGGSSAVDAWNTAGTGSTSSQKRSDQWSPDGGNTTPYAAGIPMTAGQLYYLEVVHHQATGGANLGVTYRLFGEDNPADGTVSLLNAANHNIALVTWPGTNITWVTQPVGLTLPEGANADFFARATSDAEMSVVYQWYVNGAPYPGGTGSQLSLQLVTLALNGAQIKVVASVPEGGLSITSSVVTLTVNQAVLETGFAKVERWDGATRAQVEAGTAGVPGYIVSVPGFEASIDNPGNQGNFSRRVSGFFIPPTTGGYVFFVNGDDDSDLFVSTDVSPANKRLVCQESGWSNPFTWLGVGGGGSVATQKRSDSWTPDNGATVPWANGIQLTAGQKYYIEMVFHQGGGGANCEATYKFYGDPDPANGSDTKLLGARIAINAPRSTFVNFTQQPTNTSAVVFANATFSVTGTTDSQLAIGSVRGQEGGQTNNFLAYQWQKNGVDIVGANSRTLTYGPVLPSDNAAQFVCKIRSLGYADNSLTPIWSNSLPATLTISGEPVFEPGWVRVEWWPTGSVTRLNVEAGTVPPPAFMYATPKFIAPGVGDNGNNYANRLEGFFVPPTTGDYVFFMNSDDDADLFLSTDNSPLNKRLIAREAGWAGASSLGWTQTGGGGDSLANRRSDQFTDPVTGTQLYSAGIHMTAGQKYYIEAVHHDGGGGDMFAATYKLIADPDPVNGDETKLLGNAIGFYTPRTPWVAFVQQPQSQSATSGGNSVTFSAQGTNAPALVPGDTGDPRGYALNTVTNSLIYQWYKNGVAIPGANRSSYTQVPILTSDSGAQFTVGIRALGFADNALNPIWSNSTPATLTVITDNVPPTISYAATFVNTNQPTAPFVVNVTFSEWMDSATLGNAVNYTIAGSTITNVTVGSDHKTVQLLVTAPPTLPLNVTVSGVKDLTGNTIVASSSAAINPEKLTFSDIGTIGTDPAYPTIAWVTGVGGYIISAQGSDIWGAADAFNFAWEQKTGDFDAVVRSVSITKTANAAKAGLMVREDLTPSSRNWDIVNDPASADGITAVDGSGLGANNVECNYRGTNGIGTAGWKSAGAIVPTYPNAWVRLKRTGTLLEAFSSSNRVDWVRLAGYDTATNLSGALPSQVYVGLCTTAHNNDPVVDPAPTTFKYYNTAQYADYTSSFVPSPPRPTLSFSVSGGNMSISWTPAGGHLEASPALGAGGNWQSLGTANPASVPIGPNAQFFRVVTP